MPSNVLFIFTSGHRNWLGTRWWEYYWQDCNNTQTSKGIVVCPGVEITANNSSDGADALGCWISKINYPPANRTYSESDLVDEINKNNPDYSYAALAHPDAWIGCHWITWPAASRTVEIMSNRATVDWTTYDKWLAFLRNNLQKTLSNGQFLVAVGNSDTHNPALRSPVGATWIFCPTYTSTNRGGIWSTIKAGKATATGYGNLGVFSINGYVQGSVIKSPSSLQAAVTQQPLYGVYCQKFTIYDKNDNRVYTHFSPAPDQTIYVNIPMPTEDTFYLVHFEFSDGSHAITNPIFIDR